MFEIFTTKFDKMQNLLTSSEDKKTLAIPAKKDSLGEQDGKSYVLLKDSK